MTTFIKRHWRYLGLGLLGLVVSLILLHFLSGFQIGLNPFEFVIKLFAKLVYVGASISLTHWAVKYFFSTIYAYCRTDAGATESEFIKAWKSGDQIHNHKLLIAVGVHVGVFIGICLLLALAF